eukprot:768394-Hanusia_phi.AAC.1
MPVAVPAQRHSIPSPGTRIAVSWHYRWFSIDHEAVLITDAPLIQRRRPGGAGGAAADRDFSKVHAFIIILMLFPALYTNKYRPRRLH